MKSGVIRRRFCCHPPVAESSRAVQRMQIEEEPLALNQAQNPVGLRGVWTMTAIE